MSLLAPLYFFGAMAIGLPILFHLIRRRPKGEVEFSSLMFLRPTPPRLTRKSRLDNWPLLLIRALALILLAAAFARPFLRSTALSDSDLPARRMVLLIDTSASMQRAGLWQQAIDKAGDVITDLQPADQLAIVTFDQTPKTLLGFEQSSQLTLPQRKATAKSLLAGVAPTWYPTETGKAIAYAADLVVGYEPEEKKVDGDPAQDVATETGPAHMILISDMQAGSRVESLQVYSWPDRLRLDVEKVVAKDKTNASAQILVDGPQEKSDGDKDRVRIRVVNAADSTESRFRLRWAEATGSDAVEMPIQVPPGESRVVRMPSPTPGVTSLVLGGDDHPFDNTQYVVSPQPQSMKLLYLGQTPTGPRNAAEPRESLLYYLQRVPLNNPYRIVQVESIAPDQLKEVPDPKEVPLVVVEGPVSSDIVDRFFKYVSSGGRWLYVLTADGQPQDVANSLNGLIRRQGQEVTDDSTTGSQQDSTGLVIEEASVEDYAMFSRIDFKHPVFAPMSDPQFNDFTKIRIWSHRTIRGLDESWKVLSRFDDDDPALIERVIEDGRLWVLATGWQPAESQLALSTKFIPFVFSLFDIGGRRGGGDRFTLGQAIDLPPVESAVITRPSGSAFKYTSGEDAALIDQPGIYQYSDDQDGRSFAVNLDESESRTAAIGDSELERFGVKLGQQLTTAQAEAKQRQLRDVELEKRQKLWQWLLVAVMALLAIETWLGGLISRSRPKEIESGLET